MSADVLDLVRADADAAEKRRQATRDKWPEFAACMDSMPGARMVCIHDEHGTLVAGRPPAADPESYATLSADCIVALCAWGRK